MGWPVVIGDWSVPMWVSWIGLVVAGGLAFFGFETLQRAMHAGMSGRANAETGSEAHIGAGKERSVPCPEAARLLR